jgi:hypothetical protein
MHAIGFQYHKKPISSIIAELLTQIPSVTPTDDSLTHSLTRYFTCNFIIGD